LASECDALQNKIDALSDNQTLDDLQFKEKVFQDFCSKIRNLLASEQKKRGNLSKNENLFKICIDLKLCIFKRKINNGK
jgi:hypothetical protein